MEPRCCHSSRRLPDSHHSSCSMRQQIGKWLFVSNTSALIHQGILFPLTLGVKYAWACCFFPPSLSVIVCIWVRVVAVMRPSLALVKDFWGREHVSGSFPFPPTCSSSFPCWKTNILHWSRTGTPPLPGLAPTSPSSLTGLSSLGRCGRLHSPTTNTRERGDSCFLHVR